MSRGPRIQSQSGVYHVMLRGIDKRYLFEENQDREVFMHHMIQAKEKSGCQVFGYCLMDNHVHLLLKEGIEPLGDTMKRITVGYVQWHNRKYDRTGHLFQNRYRSECVESDVSLLIVLRYIHQNPLKAGLVSDPSEYCWSSYREYIYKFSSVTDKTYVYGCFNSIDQFRTYMTEVVVCVKPQNCLIDDSCMLSDKALRAEIEKITCITSIPLMERQIRNDLISRIKRATKASNRQISRVLGIGRGIVERIR